MKETYTGVRFFFRDTKKWSKLVKLKAGFEANFVQDKMTDSANISFILLEEPDYFEINMWAALFIDADSPEFEFNEDGTPKNHEQFIIGGYQYYSTLAGYQVSMKLVEPIERFRGVLGETLTYHSRGAYEESGIKYPARIYNYYTALKRWLQVTPANTDNISRDSEDKDPNGIAWWNRITIIDKDFLSSLPFADDTFNELTLYDLLLDVYDSGTGRTPVAYFDLNTETGMPKRLDRDEYLLKFIRQDGTDKPVLEWDDLTANKGHGEVCTGVMKREDGANYATGLVSNITNLSPNTTVTFPAEGVYINPRGVQETRELNDLTNSGHESWTAVLTHKIKDIDNVNQLHLSYNKDYQTTSVQHIKRNVLERKQRDAETQLDSTRYPEYDMYDEGNTNLYTQNYSYGNDNDAYLYNIKYRPLIDARVCLGDTEYVRQINQTASQVDSDKFGKFMNAYLAGMGKADYTIQRTTEKPQDYINLIGSRVMRGEREYLITNVAFRNRNYQYDIFFQLNENHMRKNMAYLAPQNIRANTTIQYDNIQARKVNLKDRILFGYRNGGGGEKKAKYLGEGVTLSLLTALIPVNENESGVSKDFYPQYVNILCKKRDDGGISSDEQKSSNVAPFLLGNAICFNTKFQDNAISGMRLLPYQNALEYGRAAIQYPELYTNSKGELETTSLDIISVVNQDIKDGVYQHGSDKNNEVLSDISRIYNMGLNLYNLWMPVNKKIITIPKLNLQKDMFEEYNITYSLEVASGSDHMEIFPEMLQYSRLLNPNAQADHLKVIAYSGNYGDGTVLGEYMVSKVSTGAEATVPKTFYFVVPELESIKPKSILVQSKIKGIDGYVNCLLIKRVTETMIPKGYIQITYEG